MTKDFITADFHSDLSQSEIYDKLVETLPDFDWHTGDSDAMGPYIKGENKDFVNIELWLDDNIIEFSISFRSLKSELLYSKKQIDELVKLVIDKLSAFLGKPSNMNS